jgi:hypothetical protein
MSDSGMFIECIESVYRTTGSSDRGIMYSLTTGSVLELSACFRRSIKTSNSQKPTCCDTLLQQVLYGCTEIATLVAFVEDMLDGVEQGLCPSWWKSASNAELLHDAAWVLNHMVKWSNQSETIRQCVQHVLQSTGDVALKPYFVSCEIAGDFRGCVSVADANGGAEPSAQLLAHVTDTLQSESEITCLRKAQGTRYDAIDVVGNLLRQNTLHSACTLHAVAGMTHKINQTIKRSTLFSLFSNNQHGVRNPSYEHLATHVATHLLRHESNVQSFCAWLDKFDASSSEADWRGSYKTLPLTCIRSSESRKVVEAHTRLYAFGVDVNMDCLVVPAGSHAPELCSLQHDADESIRTLLFRFFDTVSANTPERAFPLSVFSLDCFLAANAPPFPYWSPLFGENRTCTFSDNVECVQCEVDHAPIEFECRREELPRLIQCCGYVDIEWRKSLCRKSGLLKLTEADSSDPVSWEKFTQPCDIHTCPAAVSNTYCVHIMYGDTRTFDLTPDVVPASMQVSVVTLTKECGNDDAYCLLVSNHNVSLALASEELYGMSLAHLHDALRRRFSTISLCLWQSVSGCEWHRKPTLFGLNVEPYPQRHTHVNFAELTEPQCAPNTDLLFDQKARASVIKSALCANDKKTHMRDSELCDAWAYQSSPLAQTISAKLLGVSFEEAPHVLQNLRLKLQDCLSPRLCETGLLMQSELMVPDIQFSHGQFPCPLIVACMLQTTRNIEASMRTDNMFEQLQLARRPVTDTDFSEI